MADGKKFCLLNWFTKRFRKTAKLEHFDIVRVVDSGRQGKYKSYSALIFMDIHGRLMMCAYYGIAQIPDNAKKVAHFPAPGYFLPNDVKYAYIDYLRRSKIDIDNQIRDFVNQTNGVVRGCRKWPKEKSSIG